MITLDIPVVVNKTLGGNDPVSFDKLVAVKTEAFPVTAQINAQIRLTASADPTMDPFMGSVKIDAASGTMLFEIPQLDFKRRIAMSAAQRSAATAFIASKQDGVESTFITLGAVAGVQSAGV